MTQTVLLAQDEITACVQAMAEALMEATGATPPVFVGIREGGDVLAERLAAAYISAGRAVAGTGVLDITLYRDDFGHRRYWPDVRASEIDVPLDDAVVVLVDDVLFTGRTVRAALEALLSYGRPRRVLLAVLVDRGHRELPIQADVVGRRVAPDRDALCICRFREQGAAQDEVVVEAA